MVNLCMKIPSLKSESIFFSSTLIFSFLFLSPIIALFIISANNSDGIWEHLLETALFKYIYNTVFLMVGVIFLSLFISIIPAWLISNYDFKFAKLMYETSYDLKKKFKIQRYLISKFEFKIGIDIFRPEESGLSSFIFSINTEETFSDPINFLGFDNQINSILSSSVLFTSLAEPGIFSL